MSANDANQCERCGCPRTPAGPLAGSCARCMMALGGDSSVAGEGDAAVNARPTVIGRYRIIRIVGEGGMGVVYEAEQDHPRRTVALKIIKPGLASPEHLRRFEREAQALGRLQHAGIAQIYEAGMADAGFGPQPYIAMEFIQGPNVKDYAEEHQLKTRQRLEIMVKIAHAVQHAHQRGLIHRDLKPENILIDESGQPKVLDFGVARATDGDTQATGHTDIGQLVGTLAYMSPEQVLADPPGLDMRSDVYALGVILYELLAGRMPYTVSKKIHEAIHAICEENPTRLSAVNRSYRGNIETIVAKALEKDKTLRYGSASEFAADITRHLKDERIVARPPSARYQLRKFTRRHTATVAGTAAVFVVLVAGMIGSGWQAHAARHEGHLANVNQQKTIRETERAESKNRLAEFAEAEPLLFDSYPNTRNRMPHLMALLLGEDSPGERIIQCYQDWENPNQLAEWRKRIQADKTRRLGAVGWQATEVLAASWNLDLIVDRGTVTGTVRPANLYDGKVNGNAITFKITTPDGNRIVTFFGKVNANAISFTRNIQFRGLSSAPRVFGMTGEMQFDVKRVE